jgi:hypothetical protein
MATHIEKDNRSWIFRTELSEPLENTAVPTRLVTAQTSVETVQHSPTGMFAIASPGEALANVF